MEQINDFQVYDAGSSPLPGEEFSFTRDRRQALVEFLSKSLEFRNNSEFAAYQNKMTSYKSFFFFDRFIPPTMTGQGWPDYRKRLETLFLTHSKDFASLYPNVTITNTDFSLAPVKTDIHSFLNPLTFLEKASVLASPDQYKTFYDEQCRFLPGTIQPLSKNSIAFFVEGSKLPKVIAPNTPEDIALLYRKAFHNQINVNNVVPTPQEVKSMGMSLLPHALTTVNNSLSQEYHETLYTSESAEYSYRPDPSPPPPRPAAQESQDRQEKIEKSFHASFVSHAFTPGTKVPPFALQYNSSFNIMSDYRYSYSKDAGHTVVLSKETPQGEKALPISSTLYESMINNSKFVANRTELTQEVKDKYLAMSNLDKDSLRTNTAANFWHNYRIMCRQDTTNPHEAMAAAKNIIREMPEEERLKFKSIVRSYEKATRPAGKPFAKPLETYNDRILKFYEENVKDLPIENKAVSDQTTLPSIVRNTAVHDKSGCPLSPVTRLKIGDPIRLTITERDPFSNKKIPITKELILTSYSDDVNKVVLIDKDKLSKYTFAKDKFVNTVRDIEKQQNKIEKAERKKNKPLRKAETIGY